MRRSPQIILLTDDPVEALRVESLLRPHVVFNWVKSLPQLRALLANGTYDALFCQWSYGMQSWKDALDTVRNITSELPVFVLSKTGGDEEWVEVLDAGAFDLLVPPYSGSSLLAVVKQFAAAHDTRNRQQQPPPRLIPFKK